VSQLENGLWWSSDALYSLLGEKLLGKAAEQCCSPW